MKTIFLLLLGALAFNLNHKQAEEPKNNTSLKVEIGNLPNSSGKVTILLFNDAKGYPVNHNLAYKINHTKISGKHAKTSWKGIPQGDYAISVFHDENNNGEFDKNWFGVPKESYGFSNIQGEFCGTPSFQQTSFHLNNEPQSISIQLIQQ